MSYKSIARKHIEIGDKVGFRLRGSGKLVEKVGTVVWIGTAAEAKTRYHLKSKPRRRQAEIQTAKGESYIKQLTSLLHPSEVGRQSIECDRGSAVSAQFETRVS